MKLHGLRLLKDNAVVSRRLFLVSGVLLGLFPQFAYANTGFASILDDPLTIVFIVINVGLTYYFTKVNFNRFAVSHGPEILTTVGILGCFTGIAIALLNFDPTKVSTSVPHLLGGVKTAFLASVSGVAGSLLIRYKHQRHGGPIPQSPGAVKAASIDDLVEATRALQASLAGKEEGSLLSQMKLMRQEQSDQLQGLRSSFDTFAARMAEDNSKALIEALKEVIRDFNTKISDQFGSNFAKLNSAVELLVIWQQQYRDELDRLQAVQHASAGDLKVAAESLSLITSRAEAYTDTAARLQELLNGLAQQHAAIQDSQRSLFTVLVEMKDVAPQFAKKLDELTESIGAGVLKVQNEVADVVRTLGNQVQGSTAEMKQLLTETLKKAQRETNEELAKSVELVHNGVTVLDKALQEELTKSLDMLGRQLAALSEKFVADYMPLTERLREVVRMAGQH